MTRMVLCILAAIAIPFAAWHFATPEERLAVGLTATPFGWPRLLFGHLAAAVPLAYRLARRTDPWGTQIVRMIVAIAITAIMANALPILGEILDGVQAGPVIRSALRSIVAIVATTAWIAVGLREPQTNRLPWFAALAVAIVPPFAYSYRLDESRAADFDTYARSGRLVRAMGSLKGLRDLGSGRTFTGKSIGELIPRLQKDLDRIAKQIAEPLPADAPTPARLQRATLLVRLNRSDSAEAILQAIDSPTADVWLLRAAIARESGRWSDLESFCREAIRRHQPSDSQDLLEDAYDGLGEALRRLGRPDDAAASYRDAANRLPHRTGYYRFQQGLIAAERGQTNTALEDFSESLRLDPALKPLVDPQIRKVQANFASCFNPRK